MACESDTLRTFYPNLGWVLFSIFYWKSKTRTLKKNGPEWKQEHFTTHSSFLGTNYHHPTSMVFHWRCAKLNEVADGRTTHNSEEEQLTIPHLHPDVRPHPLHIQRSLSPSTFVSMRSPGVKVTFGSTEGGRNFMEINSVPCGDFYSSSFLSNLPSQHVLFGTGITI